MVDLTRWRLGLLLAAGVCLPAPAGAQTAATEASFPAGTTRQAVLDWLRQSTNIPPERVASVSPDSVVAIMARSAESTPGAYRVVIRGEVVDAKAFAKDGVLSWHASVYVDCTAGRARQGAITGYPARNLLLGGRTTQSADTDWRSGSEEAHLKGVREAVCVEDFRWPLAGPAQVTAAAERAKPPAPSLPVRQAARPPAPSPAPLPAPPQPAPPVSASGNVAIQLAAMSDPAKAEALLDLTRRKYPKRMGGLTTRVEAVAAGGATLHRALVEGFASAAEAQAFCTALTAAGQPCLVRR
jgi:cell division septation protein DedD